ncbi:MAG: PAS domain S-box protein, partial [Acinetobacter sp.]
MEEPNQNSNNQSPLNIYQSISSPSQEQQINAMIESAPFPIAVYIGREMRVVRANKAVIDVWGKGPDVIGKIYKELLPELEGTGIYQRLDDVYTSGIPFNIRNSKVDLTINGTLKEFYFNYSFTPLFDDNGNVYGVMNTAADVTDLNLAKQHAEFSEKNFRNMILQAPMAMSLLRGPSFIIDLVNDAMLDIWGKPLAQVTGKPVFEALPDAKEQGLEYIMESVYRTGEPFFANETPVNLIRHGKQDTVFQNFVYQAYRDSYGAILGILAISVDVSEQVKARKELEKAYEQIQLSKTAAQLGTFDLDLEKGTMEWDERCRQLFGIAHTNQVTYEQDFVQGLHPEDRERIITIIDDLLNGKLPDGNYDVEYRTVGQLDQQIRWVRAKGKVYYENNKPKRFI